MRPSMSSNTCAAAVGLGRPERFALGAATGTPASSMSLRATGCSGSRMATVSSPAVTFAGTRADFGKIIVSGPGQKASIIRRAPLGRLAIDQRPQLFGTADVQNQRVVAGTALRLKDPRDRRGVQPVCPEAVDRFRRKGDQLARPDARGGLADGGVARGKNAGVQ